ncbi:hypothetical protein DSC45_13065 [Streptomyces sp. YIM 130001]|nr:hypothetical protein DSC45_13065 [Streptomyces sp. YIM 130001]
MNAGAALWGAARVADYVCSLPAFPPCPRPLSALSPYAVSGRAERVIGI